MSDVSLIGLGSMGSSLARALVTAGHVVTVWNRTPEKSEPLVSLGAIGTVELSDAVKRSPLVLVCIDNYSTTEKILGAEGIAPDLRGRTLVQFSTGTPQEARNAEVLFGGFGADYLDGALMLYPEEVGNENALIFLSGVTHAYERSRPYIQCLAGDLRYLGEPIGRAAALDLAILSYDLGSLLGLVHGALICESEGVGVDLFGSTLVQQAMDTESSRRAQVIHSGSFDDADATLGVYEKVVQRLRSQADDTRINGEIPEFISRTFERALAAGYSNEDVSALIKVLRSAPKPE